MVEELPASAALPPWGQQAVEMEAARHAGALTGAVQFHRWQAEFLGDVCVFDGQGLLHLKCRGEKRSLVNLTLLWAGRTHLRIGCLRKLLQSSSTQFLGRTATVHQGISVRDTPVLPGLVSKNKTHCPPRAGTV